MRDDAKSYERLGLRSKIRDNKETRDLLLNDTLNNIETTVNKDGHTGKLGNSDGILRGKVNDIHGFTVQCFGQIVYQNQFDITGELRWFGFAKREDTIKGKKTTVEFDTHDIYPLGMGSEHECGNYLCKLIDAYDSRN